MSEKKTKERRDAAITEANKRRRIAKDMANKQRAARKRAQRKSKQEMALLASPNFDPRCVSKRTLIAITRKHFGVQDTAARIQDFLDDEDNVFRRGPAHPALASTNGFKDNILRRPFQLANGGSISIQQSALHYCGKGTFEVAGPWHECMQDTAARDEGRNRQIFACVPLAKLVEYVDALETGAP